jgi:hypothetical protein
MIVTWVAVYVAYVTLFALLALYVLLIDMPSVVIYTLVVGIGPSTNTISIAFGVNWTWSSGATVASPGSASAAGPESCSSPHGLLTRQCM